MDLACFGCGLVVVCVVVWGVGQFVSSLFFVQGEAVRRTLVA